MIILLCITTSGNSVFQIETQSDCHKVLILKKKVSIFNCSKYGLSFYINESVPTPLVPT